MNSSAILLRPWKESDLDSFSAMNADPRVMNFMLKTLDRTESEALFRRLKKSIEDQGWGLWAVKVGGELAGFTGLSVPAFEASFTPCVEIGWRLHHKFWGQSIAYTAARQAEDFAFNRLALPEIVSFTTVSNLRSRKLMERLGFRRDPGDDFLHPNVPEGHPLRPHVLYRKANPS